LYPNPTALIHGKYYACEKNEDFVLRQICLRLLSYHAIATNDCIYFEWLVRLGLDMDELCEYYDKQAIFDKPLGKHGGYFTPLAGRPRQREVITFPSLLSVAARKDSLEWIEILRTWGANMRDSTALLYAVKTGAKIGTIDYLLQMARSQRRSAKDKYGSAALRQALRSHRLDVAVLLCKEVNIDTVELPRNGSMKLSQSLL
jgi:hypothetical protein